MANVKRVALGPTYPKYRFNKGDKDPIIDRMRTMLEDEGIKISEAAKLSGLSETTIRNWIDGDTLRPQFASVMALTRGCGYDLQIVRPDRRINPSAVTFRRNIRAKSELGRSAPLVPA